MPHLFHRASLAKSRDRYQKAVEALDACRNTSDFAAFESAWSNFLIHTGGVLHGLLGGSKKSPQAMQWYGGVKKRGKADPLVSYFHQARNAEEHTEQPIARHVPGWIGIGEPGQTVTAHQLIIDEAFWANPEGSLASQAETAFPAQNPSITMTPAGTALVPVVDDTYGQNRRYDPPTSHNGKPLENDDPVSVGAVYLDYLRELIEQAEKLA